MSDYHYGFLSGAAWMYAVLFAQHVADRLIRKYRTYSLSSNKSNTADT